SLLEGGLEALQAVDAIAERLDGARVRYVHRPGWIESFGLLLLVLGGLHVAAELGVEILRVETWRGEQRSELLSEPCRRVPDRADVCEIRPVPVELRLLRAPLHPDHEQDDHEDRERDQPDEPQDRREVARRPESGSTPSPPPLGRRRLAFQALGLL